MATSFMYKLLMTVFTVKPMLYTPMLLLSLNGIQTYWIIDVWCATDPVWYEISLLFYHRTHGILTWLRRLLEQSGGAKDAALYRPSLPAPECATGSCQPLQAHPPELGEGTAALYALVQQVLMMSWIQSSTDFIPQSLRVLHLLPLCISINWVVKEHVHFSCGPPIALHHLGVTLM